MIKFGRMRVLSELVQLLSSVYGDIVSSLMQFKLPSLHSQQTKFKSPFLENPHERVLEDKYCFAIYDKYPVTEGHMLIISQRVISDYFDLNPIEREAMWQMVDYCKRDLKMTFKSISGFNIGINVGTDAGQTVPHVHIHLIPRRPNDMRDPRGGVRGCIPWMRIYD